MEFQKISSPSLRDLFIEQLEHLILSGKLQVGEKLPSERQLAEMMQVSRAVVNSGISELEKKGFLTVKPRSGTYVADFRRKGTLDIFVADRVDGELCSKCIECNADFEDGTDLLITHTSTIVIHDCNQCIQRLLEFVNQIRDAQDVTTAIEAALNSNTSLP